MKTVVLMFLMFASLLAPAQNKPASSSNYGNEYSAKIDNHTYLLDKEKIELQESSWTDGRKSVYLDRFAVAEDGGGGLAVILIEHHGGPERLYHLVGLDKDLRQVAYLFLGDRIKISKLSVAKNLITLTADHLKTGNRTVTLPLPPPPSDK